MLHARNHWKALPSCGPDVKKGHVIKRFLHLLSFWSNR